MKIEPSHNYTDFAAALKAMGYRRPDAAKDPNRWVKPVGYNVFIAHVKELTLNCHAVFPNGDFGCWESGNIELNKTNYPIEVQIATIEQCKNYQQNYRPFSFGFLTKEEWIEQMVGI